MYTSAEKIKGKEKHLTKLSCANGQEGRSLSLLMTKILSLLTLHLPLLMDKIPKIHRCLFLNRKMIKELIETLNKSPQPQAKLKRRRAKPNRNRTCWQGGQNHSPSGIIIKGGRRQAVWYPLSHESHNKICANKMNHDYLLAFVTWNKLQNYSSSQHRSAL